MAILNVFKELFGDLRKINFIGKMELLAEKADPQTAVFTNVRRLDDVYLSEYAIDAALDDYSPVWLLSDQGKIFLAKAAPASDVEHKTVPPAEGDYIFICDYNARRQDIRTRHFTYTREPKTISDDVVAYLFDAEKNILICTANADAVEAFKKIVAYRQAKASPETARITIDISRNKQWSANSMTWFKAFNVYVDGVKIGSVDSGKSKMFAMTEGEHELRLKTIFGMERSEPVRFNIAFNQHLKFRSEFSTLALLPLVGCATMLPSVKGIELIKVN